MEKINGIGPKTLQLLVKGVDHHINWDEFGNSQVQNLLLNQGFITPAPGSKYWTTLRGRKYLHDMGARTMSETEQQQYSIMECGKAMNMTGQVNIIATIGNCKFGKRKNRSDIEVFYNKKLIGFISKSKNGFGVSLTKAGIYFAGDGSIRSGENAGGCAGNTFTRQKEAMQVAAIIAEGYISVQEEPPEKPELTEAVGDLKDVVLGQWGGWPVYLVECLKLALDKIKWTRWW